MTCAKFTAFWGGADRCSSNNDHKIKQTTYVVFSTKSSSEKHGHVSFAPYGTIMVAIIPKINKGPARF